MKTAINLTDVRKAQEATADARANYRAAEKVRNETINALRALDVNGVISGGVYADAAPYIIKRLAERGNADALAMFGAPEYAAARAAVDAVDAARETLSACETYQGALTEVYGYQVRYVVGRALVDRADEWTGKPAYYKRTRAILERIASDALEGADLRVYTVVDSWGGVDIRFLINNGTPYGVDLKPVDMEKDGAGNLKCEYFANWYGAYSHAEKFADLTPADVRRLCRRRAKDLARVRELSKRYRDAVNAITDRYLYTGLNDDFDREILRPR